METGKNDMKRALAEITPEQIWNGDKVQSLRDHIRSESAKQTEEEKLRIQLLAIKYRMQAYINDGGPEGEMQLIDFVKAYLKALKITQKGLAEAFEMKAGNLHKYLSGERRLNPDIALKLSAFSHTQPELWYHIQTKNELDELKKEKGRLKKYDKYKYENFMAAG